MKTTKERKNELMKLANQVISKSPINNNGIINDSYNGQIAAFSVSIALSGLKPTMAIYHVKSDSKLDKNEVVKLLAEMYSIDKGKKHDDNSLYNMVCNATNKEEDELKKLIIEYAIALKLTVRTFKLLKS